MQISCRLLFHYFYDNGAFLYVNSLLGLDHSYEYEYDASRKIKDDVKIAMGKCTNFLFLKSVNSARQNRASHWCAFEMGVADTSLSLDNLYKLEIAFYSISIHVSIPAYGDYHEFYYLDKGKIIGK